MPISFRIWNTLDIVPEVPAFPYIHVSGLGDAIVQTQQQLATLRVTPKCEHVLTSYLWLLDPLDFQLPVACDHTAGLVIDAAEILSVPGIQDSARVLRRATCGSA